MAETEQKNVYTIDATEKRLGRVATEVAMYLMGKHAPSFERHKKEPIAVRVVHASRLHLPEKKRMQKIYTSYSGFPSGLKERNMGALIERHGYEEVVRKAVYGMLPNNKLRAEAMKRLIVEA